MTELQVKAAQLAEDKRHNLVQEQLGKYQTDVNKQHYERSDTISQEHYARSDQASLISANASAMNAEVNKGKLDLELNKEYPYGIDFGYPSGTPISTQKIISEIEQNTLEHPLITRQFITGEALDADGVWQPTGYQETTKHPNTYVDLQKQEAQYKLLETKATALNKALTGINSVLNTTFGKGGIIQLFDKQTN